jgi:delta24(24(1))-sterol reductase
MLMTMHRDMYYEKLGFMLIFWNMAGVPLSYCHSILYIAKHDPAEYHWPIWFIVMLIAMYCGVYYVWDTCNSQKNQFRLEEKGIQEERTTFPYFKYGKIHNPKTIPTKHGNKILVDGWCMLSLFLISSYPFLWRFRNCLRDSSDLIA